MIYKAYYHRYGSIDFEEFESLEESINFIKEGADHGELFGDCVTDYNDIIVHDFDSATEVFGRETPKSREGSVYQL